MIRKLKYVNSKSFNNYSCDEDLSEVNIFFGTNGSGKSALSKWLLSQDNEHTRVFDTDYGRNNILAKNGISGVSLRVGKEALDLEILLECIRNAQENIRKSNEKLATESKIFKEDLYNLLDQELEEAKKRFETQNIRQKSHAKKDPQKALQTWYTDINENLSQETNSVKELEQELKLKKNSLNNLQPVLEIKEERYKEFLSVLETPILVPTEKITATIASWLDMGLSEEVHDMTKSAESCKFCGNSFNGPDLEKSIKEKLDTQYARTITTLEKLKAELLSSKKKSEKLEEIDSDSFIESVDEIIKVIDKKITDTNQIFFLEADLWVRLSAVDKEVESKRKTITEEIESLEKNIYSIELVAKSWVGSQLKSNSKIDEICVGITDREKKIKKNEEAIQSNEQWIREKQNVNSNLQPFATLVNHQFEMLGLDFVLEVDEYDKTYNVRHKNQEISLTPENFSEGELRLVAFLHFYYDLFDRPDESLVANLNAVIIDDPITSLDMENRYYLTELINKFIKKAKKLNKQLFIFTHSSLDFHNFGYGEKSIKHFRISKDVDSHSQIRKLDRGDLKNYSDYYKTFFEQLFEFAIMGKTKIEKVDNFRQYANQARIVFESHARTHYKIENATSTEENLPKLYEVYNITEEKQCDFGSMLNVINSLSHGFSFTEQNLNEIPVGQVHKVVKQMFGVLYKKDSAHVMAMIDKEEFKNSDNNKPENWF